MTIKTSALVLLAATAACTDADDTTSAQETQAVIQHHIESFLANDMEALLSDYTPESRLFYDGAVYVGPDDLRELFTGFFQLMPAASVQLAIDKASVDGDTYFMTFHGDSALVTVPFASCTATVENGKIMMQSDAFVIEPKS
jgi:ketosteroid isomerase-like protein